MPNISLPHGFVIALVLVFQPSVAAKDVQSSASLSKAERREVTRLETTLHAQAPALFGDFSYLHQVAIIALRCGVGRVETTPILERMMEQAAPPPEVAHLLRRLERFEVRADDEKIAAWGKNDGFIGDCEGWRLDGIPEWLARHPPNRWTSDQFARKPPPPDTILTEAQAQEWRTLEFVVIDIDRNLEFEIRGAIESHHLLALCDKAPDLGSIFAHLLDYLSVPGPQRAPPRTSYCCDLEQLSQAQRSTVERYMELLLLNDRYGDRVWDELGVTSYMRTHLCTQAALEKSRLHLNNLAAIGTPDPES